MASKTPTPGHDMTEHCPECGMDTHHTVEIEIRTESDGDRNVEFSREPYRVATCAVCESQTVRRMNNA